MFDPILSGRIRYPGAAFRRPWDAAVEQLTAATTRNPDDAAAHADLAEALMVLWCFGFESRGQSVDRACNAAMRAVEIDGRHANARIVSGIVSMADWEWALAEEQLRFAIDLSPLNAKAHHWYALFLAAMGRHARALEQSRLAVALDPCPGYRTGLGAVLYFAHDFEQMLAVMRETVADAPDSAPAHDWLGMAHVQLRQFDESIAAYEKAVALSDGVAEIVAGLGHALGRAGRTDEAREVIARLESAAEKWYVPPVQIAYVCAGLNDLDGVFRHLKRARAERSWELVFMREEPWFDHLHTDERFTAVLAQLAFPRRES